MECRLVKISQKICSGGTSSGLHLPPDRPLGSTSAPPRSDLVLGWGARITSVPPLPAREPGDRTARMTPSKLPRSARRHVGDSCYPHDLRVPRLDASGRFCIVVTSVMRKIGPGLCVKCTVRENRAAVAGVKRRVERLRAAP